jgi:hypothetical protein
MTKPIKSVNKQKEEASAIEQVQRAIDKEKVVPKKS